MFIDKATPSAKGIIGRRPVAPSMKNPGRFGISPPQRHPVGPAAPVSAMSYEHLLI